MVFPTFGALHTERLQQIRYYIIRNYFYNTIKVAKVTALCRSIIHKWGKVEGVKTLLYNVREVCNLGY